MGYKVMAEILPMDVGGLATKAVLLVLAAHADNVTGECYPSFSTLAKECNAGRRTVIDNINKLIGMGVIEKRERFNASGQTSNGYKILSPIGGAGAALGVVQEPHPPSAGAALGVVQEPHPNQSFELVIESVNTHKAVCAPAGGLTHDEVTEAIEHLNSVTGKAFRVTSRASRDLVGKLGADGFSLDDIKAVIDHKQATWGEREEMASNVQPSTLFNPGKFEEYLANARAWSRPAAQPASAPMDWGGM